MSSRGILMRLVLALVISWAVLEPFNDWRFTPRLLEYSVPDMLDPSSGYWYLVVVVFLCLWVPTLPLAPEVAVAHADPSVVEPRPAGEVIVIPRAAPRDLDEQERRDAAAALGIGWQQRFSRDDGAWEAAYHQMLRRAAR